MVLRMCPLNKFLGLMLSVFLLAACAAAPEKKSGAELQAIRFSERGTVAFLQADYVSALTEYAQGLRVNLSIENAAGIATSRINLARVWRELARPEAAHTQLDALFAAPVLPYPATSLAAAASLQAQLYLENNDTVSAAQWLDRGVDLCQKNCALAASLAVLRTQLLMREKNYTAARSVVDEAVKTLQTSHQIVEWANALRLSGEIYFAQGDEVSAMEKFAQALALDQKLGLPTKIHLDLLRLAETATHAGKIAEAKNYTARAEAVSQAMRDAHHDAVPTAPH